MSFTDMISASSTDDEENLSASATNADPELPGRPPFDKFLYVDPMVLAN
jgi:hypothetical protein